MDYAVAIGSIVLQRAPEWSGLIAPLIVDWLNKDVPDERGRFLISIVVCILLACAVNSRQIAYGTPDGVVGSIAMIFFESQVVYRLYFKNSWLRSKLQEHLEARAEATIEQP